MAIFGYQFVIFFSILLIGSINKKARIAVTAFWIIWTIIMVYMPWLAALQIGTILFALYILQNFKK